MPVLNHSIQERLYLRNLAQHYIELARLPVMAERTALWFRHNRLHGERPVIVMEMATFENDMLPPLKCESEFGQRMELELQRHIINCKMIGDDKVVPDYFTVIMDIDIKLFGLVQKREYAKDVTGRKLGWHDEHFIKDIENDFSKLSHSEIIYDRVKTEEYIDFARDVLGDIMPIRVKNCSLDWLFGISNRIIELMGMEALMYAIYDSPELVSRLYDYVCGDLIGVLRKMESLKLLTPNNGNDYAGSGSYGFSDELKPNSAPEGGILSSMLWGNMNSQETVGISPEMYGEFAYPAYERAAREFGLVYYGCCEPVHPVWENYISKLPNLRKVSVSPWCDEKYMGEALRKTRVIYSRKPSPNFIGVGHDFDEEAYGNHIAATLRAAKGCKLEFIHRDIYTLSGNLNKPRRAVEIIRRKIDDMWQA